MARAAEDDDEDDDDDIGEYVVEGKELKRTLKRAMRRPVPFAFCPVSGDETTWFASHRKKTAALIARKTKKASGQPKVAYGTFVVEGRLVILTCIELLPNLAYRVKKHFAREGLRRSVRALDIDGTEMGAEIDDFGDAPLDEDDDEDAPAGTLEARLEAVQEPVLAARGESGNRLRHMLAGIFAAQDKGDRTSADTLLDKLEDEVRKLMNSAARPVVAAPEAPVVDRKEQVALARALEALRQRIEVLEEVIEDRLMRALGIGARQIRGGDLIGAADTIGRVRDAVDRVEQRARA